MIEGGPLERGGRGSIRRLAVATAVSDSGNWAAGEGGRIVVTDEHVAASLDELLAERSALTRMLLGGAQEESRTTGPRDWLLAEYGPSEIEEPRPQPLPPGSSTTAGT